MQLNEAWKSEMAKLEMLQDKILLKQFSVITHLLFYHSIIYCVLPCNVFISENKY